MQKNYGERRKNRLNCDKKEVFYDMDLKMSIVREIILGAIPRGAELQNLCNLAGINPTDIYDADRWVDLDQSIRIWDICLKMTNDPLLGLHIGEQLTPNVWGMVGFFMQSCETLGESLKIFSKYLPVICPQFKYELKFDLHHVYLHINQDLQWENNHHESARQSVDLTIASIHTLLKSLTGKKISPIRVELKYLGRNSSEYTQILQTDVRFNSEKNIMILSKEHMSLPVIGYNKSLYTLLSNAFIEKENKFHRERTFAERVKRVLLLSGKGRLPSIDIAASHFNITSRTFQRKLKQEGVNYRFICKEVKKELALSYIKTSNPKIEMVANKLGYSDSSSFRKAFKNWTQTTPGKIT